VAAESSPAGSTASEDDGDEDVQAAEQEIARCLVRVTSDGSPLVRAEVAIGKQKIIDPQKRTTAESFYLENALDYYGWHGNKSTHNS
jgi:hypothetical protein